MNDPNQKSGADFGQWQNTQSPQKFNQMLSRGGGTAFKPQGITPPGPNHSLDWSAGGGQELSKGGDRSQKAFDRNEPYTGTKDWAPRGGEGGSPWNEGPAQGPFTPMGQMGPKGGPMGPWGGRGVGQPDPAPRGGEGGGGYEGGPQGPFNPMPPMDPKYPMGPQNQYFNTSGTSQLPPNPNRPMQAAFGGGQMSPMQRSILARRPQQAPIPDPRFPDPGATLPIDNQIDQGPGLANQYGISPFQWRT